MADIRARVLSLSHNPSCPCCLVRLPDSALRFYCLLRGVDALPHNLHESIGVERVAECDRPGRIGIEGDNRFAPSGLVMAFQAAWMVIQRSCGG